MLFREVERLLVFGVDPGLATTGVAVIEVPLYPRPTDPGNPNSVARLAQWAQVHAAQCISTKKTKAKKSSITYDRARRLRSIIRDLRRLRSELPNKLNAPLERIPVTQVIWSAETFQVGRGHVVTTNGIFSLAVYGAVVGLSSEIPGDLYIPASSSVTKVAVTGKKSASKAEVYNTRAADLEAVSYSTAELMGRLTPKGKARKNKTWPNGNNEHVGDAFACAVYAAQYYLKHSLGDIMGWGVE